MSGAGDSPWARPYLAGPGGEAYLFFAVFGASGGPLSLEAKRYRVNGIPPGIEVAAYARPGQDAVLDSLASGHAWERLWHEDPGLAERIRAAPGCVVLRGGCREVETLGYLRDAVGIVTALLDQGGLAVLDLQILHFWTPEEWRTRIFEPAGPVPDRHAVILVSEERDLPGTVWFHTRGMRKFGRPDLSIHHVGPACRDGVLELCERFIGFMARGGEIPEGEAIRMRALPPGGQARHGGDLEDPDFNNRHVELVWPDRGLRG